MPEPAGVPFAATFYGTSGYDNLSGTSGDDAMYGLEGDDKVSCRGGNDETSGKLAFIPQGSLRRRRQRHRLR